MGDSVDKATAWDEVAAARRKPCPETFPCERLTGMAKAHADAITALRAAEAENARLREEVERLSNTADDRCDHAQYKGMAVHGRCCPDCGTFLNDPGD